MKIMVKLGPAIRRYANELRKGHAHRRLWRNAESFQELCQLMEEFVYGNLVNWPYHLGPRNQETIEIAGALAYANQQGFLTTGSQPGCHEPMVNRDGSVAECGASWDQRATVEGFCTPEMSRRLASVVAGTRLRMTVNHANPQRKRIDHSTATTVTMVAGEEYTAFGATLSEREIEFMWQGIAEHLLDEIIPMCQVMIYDPQWGKTELLWESLLKL